MAMLVITRWYIRVFSQTLGYLWAISRQWNMSETSRWDKHSPDVWYMSWEYHDLQKRRKRNICVFWRCSSWKWLIKGRCCLMGNGQGQKHRQPEWLKWVNFYPRASDFFESRWQIHHITLYYSRAYINLLMDISDISDEWWYLLISYCIQFAPQIRSKLIQFQGHLLKLDPGWRNWRPRMPLSQGNLEWFSPEISRFLGGGPPMKNGQT